MNPSSTAILIFSRPASEEAFFKTYDCRVGLKGNQKIAQQLISKTEKIAEATGLPVFLADKNQYGDCFGERLDYAVDWVYGKGYEKVIVIGNDCPQLTTEMLLSTDVSLNDEDIVLGPATDGGVYLIGINRNAYHRERFIHLSWESDILQSDLKSYSSFFKLKTIWLSELKDIDTSVDFASFFFSLSRLSLLKKYFERLVRVLNRPFLHVSELIPRLYIFILLPQRAPPL